jgi:tRNA threonylcarbamoyladenosine dehydratase
MKKQNERTALLIGASGIEILKNAKVAIFGIGGVGGYVVEALARAGVGALDLIDKDVVDESNINRQIIALHNTIGMDKVEVMAARVRQINPDIAVMPYKLFYLPENAASFDLSVYDYIVDAIDNVTAKVELAYRAKEANIPLIASMGTGNKMDASGFRVADISETSGCPLAKVIRKQLKSKGIDHLKVVCSNTVSIKNRPPGSISYVPPIAGLLMAGEVVRDILKAGGHSYVRQEKID